MRPRLTAVVIGGGNVGFDVASRLASRADVVVVDERCPPWLASAVAAGTIRYVAQDVLGALDRAEILRAASLGPDEPPDILVCTVGTYSQVSAADDAAGFEAEFLSNVFGNVGPVKAFLPIMRARGRGHIIILSSTSGHHAPENLTSYGPAKWALESFCGSLWGEARRHGIKVDVIVPTTIRNLRSDVFSFDAGIAPSLVGAKVEAALERPGRHRRFVPARFRSVRFLERLAPSLLDRRAGRGGLRRRRRQFSSRRPRTGLVTGASSGLGRELALAYAPTLDRLHILARTPGALESLARDIRRRHPACDVRIDIVDLTKLEAVSAYAATLPPVDLLVNNAGFHVDGSILDTSMDLYERVFAANFFAAVRLTMGLLGRSHPPATIINVLSTTAIAGRRDLSAYSASKAAFWSFTRSLRRLHGDATHVLEVLPATFDSSLFEKGIRLGGARRVRSAREQALHQHVMGSSEVARRIVAAEMQGREILFLPPLEARLFLWLELFAPPLFRRLFC